MMNCRLLRRKTAVKQLYIVLEYKYSVSSKRCGFMQQSNFPQSMYELIGAGWCQAQPLCNSGYVNHRWIKQHIHYLNTICSDPTQLIGDASASIFPHAQYGSSRVLFFHGYMNDTMPATRQRS